jgi:type 2 lantibiotic biosynthesis protein LanM
MMSQAVAISTELLEIIARAAPPGERASGDYFDPLPGQAPGLVDRRVAEWAEALADGDPARFGRILAGLGLDMGQFERGLADVVVRDPERLPGWGHVLADLLTVEGPAATVMARTPAEDAVGSPPRDDVFAPFVRLGAAELACLGCPGASIAASAAADLLNVLRRRLLTAARQVLAYELRIAGATSAPLWDGGRDDGLALDGSVDAWLGRFRLYPALAYVVGVTFANWRDACGELLSRLEGDRALLAERLFDGQDPGPLTDVRGDAGDIHGRGRSVAVLTFASGRRAVYKPKDLRIAAAYLELVRFLNGAGLELPLHVRAIVPRGPYAWEEHVDPAPCATPSEVERFYRRMGMTIRLLQLLEARDFWLDNLIAHGEQPVFIDLEMLLQPRARPAEAYLPAELEGYRRLEESAIPTAAIVMNTVIDVGVSAEDLGALTTARAFLAPFKAPESPRAGANGHAASERVRYVTWSHPEHVPTLDGAPADAGRYLEQLLDGYRAMDACLRANRSRLLAPDGPLRGMAEMPVRYIHLDTWTCYQIGDWSVAPSRLVDGIRRERFLARLVKKALDRPDATEADLRIAASEIESFRRLDVPLFQTLPGGNAVMTLEADTIRDYFDGNPWDRLVERLRADDEAAVEQQADLVRSCFATGHRGRDGRPDGQAAGARRTAAGPDRAAISDGRWLDVAIEIGDFILGEAVGAPADGLAWLGLAYHPLTDLSCVDILRPDLLTGTCGLAVLFADLYALSGRPRFRDAARGALAATRRAIARERAGWARGETASPAGWKVPPACGAFYGSGAHIYALRRCALALDAPALEHLAADYLELLPLPDLHERALLDVVCGLAGLLLAMLPRPDDLTRSAPLDVARSLAEGLLGRSTLRGARPSTPYPRLTPFLGGLPVGTEGLALALARLANICPPEEALRYRDAALQLLDVGGGGEPQADQSGGLLARLALLHLSGIDAGAVLAEADRYLRLDVPSATSHQLLDALEVALTAFQATGRRRFHDRARILAGTLCERQRLTGSWFAERFAADRHDLSIVHGLAAVAHAFLKLHDPASVRSVRLAE